MVPLPLGQFSRPREPMGLFTVPEALPPPRGGLSSECPSWFLNAPQNLGWRHPRGLPLGSVPAGGMWRMIFSCQGGDHPLL